jgi:hypothetical protein
MVMREESEVIADPCRSARMLWADMPPIPIMSASRGPVADS